MYEKLFVSAPRNPWAHQLINHSNLRDVLRDLEMNVTFRLARPEDHGDQLEVTGIGNISYHIADRLDNSTRGVKILWGDLAGDIKSVTARLCLRIIAGRGFALEAI